MHFEKCKELGKYVDKEKVIILARGHGVVKVNFQQLDDR